MLVLFKTVAAVLLATAALAVVVDPITMTGDVARQLFGDWKRAEPTAAVQQ